MTSLNINVKTVMKNPEMLEFVPNQVKTKLMCSIQLKYCLIY